MSYSKFAGVTALLSGVFAFLNMLLSAMALNFDTTAMGNPASLLYLQDISLPLFRLGMICDFLGYYVLLLPAILYLPRLMQGANGQLQVWSKLMSTSGTIYIVLGAVGAAIIISVWLPILENFEALQTEEQTLQKELFILTANIVYDSLWNITELFFAGIFWMIFALLLPKQNRIFATTSIVLGMSCWLDSLGTATGFAAAAQIGMSMYLILAPFWSLALGRFLIKRSPLLYHTELQQADPVHA